MVKKEEDLKPTDTDYYEERVQVVQPKKRLAGFTSFQEEEAQPGLGPSTSRTRRRHRR